MGPKVKFHEMTLVCEVRNIMGASSCCVEKICMLTRSGLSQVNLGPGESSARPGHRIPSPKSQEPALSRQPEPLFCEPLQQVPLTLL
jgi:hypothetical protein